MDEHLQHKNIKDIWENLYLVSIPELYLYDEETIRNRGIPTTGDATLDKEMYGRYVTVYKTINKIFELFRSGVSVKVVNYDDTEKIYNAIQRHLVAWVNFIQNGLYLHNAPFEDLLELDRFASVVYDKAKFVFKEENLKIINGAANNLGIDLNPSTFMSISGRSTFTHLYKTDEEKRAETNGVDLFLRERKSFEDEFLKVASRYDKKTKDNGDNLDLPFQLRPGNEK